MSILTKTLLWSLLISASSALPAYHLASAKTENITTPLPPSIDPWYTAPARYDLAAPGTILRLRSAPGNLTTVVANTSAAYNILYRTTDSRYNATWAVTTLFVPLVPSTSTPSLLSYQIAYDTADVDGSPSYALYTDIPSDIPAALGRGWHVSVPDYEGPLASYTAGVISGHATIDSVRAVLNSGFALPPTGSRYAMWGYSGGALASEWAAELAVQYAPELTFAGAALGGLTPNVSSVLETVTGTLAAGLIPGGILGVASQYPDALKYLLSQLKQNGTYNATTFLSARNMTLDGNIETFAGQNIYNYFISGAQALDAPLTQQIIHNDGLMGYHGVPQMPIYAYKAIGDEISPIADTDALVERFCGVGANILYQRNTVGGHSADATNGDAMAFSFLEAVFNGTWAKGPYGTGCMIQNVTVNVTSSPI